MILQLPVLDRTVCHNGQHNYVLSRAPRPELLKETMSEQIMSTASDATFAPSKPAVCLLVYTV